MAWYGRTIYYRKKPTFEGEGGIALAVEQHFPFIKRAFHPSITEFIKDIISSVQLSSKEIDSWSGTRFRIGEIGFYTKEGNLYLEAPEEMMAQLQTIGNKYFHLLEVKKIYSHDDDPTLIVELVAPYWH